MADIQPKSPASTSNEGTAAKQQKLDFRRDESTFMSRYSNNVIVESSAFDVKLIFGLLDQSNTWKQSSNKLSVEQHTEISLSWPEVKLLIYFMQLHLAGHEKENGKIKIPSNALPPEIPATPPPPFDNPQSTEVFEIFRKMRAEFIAKLNEP